MAARWPPTAPAPKTQMRKALSSGREESTCFPRYGYCFCLAGSLDGLDDAPAPLLDESLDEDDGEEGAGAAGLDGLLLLELEEPDGELGREDGLVMPPDELPEVLPAPVVERSAPRSHAAIRLAPSARDTATAIDESFMKPP